MRPWMLLLEVHSCHLHFQLWPLLCRRWPSTKARMKNVFKPAREMEVCINSRRSTCYLPRWTYWWRSLKTELMKSKKSCTFMIHAWRVKNVETLGIQGTIVLKPTRMWTSSTTTTIIINGIKDGISNRGQTTKVTIKVIIIITSINHPWEN